MGVDHAPVHGQDSQVGLCRAGPEEQQIAGPRHVIDALETGRSGSGEHRGKVALTHGIRGNRRQGRSDPVKRDDHEADAIEAVARIAPAKAEWRSGEAFGLRGERGAAARHTELGGRRVSRSLPGNDGSPWKLIELANRAAHVAIV